MVATSDRAEFEDRRHSRYRQAKATKRGGTGVGKSEPFVVPSKPGNSRPEDPVEGREGRVSEPWEGNMAGTPSPRTGAAKQTPLARLRTQTPDRSVTPLAHLTALHFVDEARRLTSP